MAFSIPNYPIQQSPFDITGSLTAGIAMRLAQEQARKQAADAQKQELLNPYEVKNMFSEINQRNASAGYQGEEAANARYKRVHGLLQPELVQLLNSAYGGKIPSGLPGSAAAPTGQPSASQSPAEPSLPDKLKMTMIGDQAQAPGMQSSQSITDSIAKVLPQMQQASQPAAQQPQPSAMIAGTSIPSTGRGPLADAIVLHALGISPQNTATAGYRDIQQKTMESNLKAASFDKMPAAQRTFAINQAMGFGLSNTEATKELREGKTIEDIAKDKGYDPNKPDEWPLPKAPPTTAMMTQQQRANVSNAGLNAIDPIVTSALAPYASRWNGTSLKQLSDSVRGENPDQQAKAIAAGALSMEIAALRLRAGGVQNIGIEALKETVGKAQNNLKTFGPTLNKKVYTKAQQEIGRMINVINKAENKALWSQQESQFDAEDKASDAQQSNEHADLSNDELDAEIARLQNAR